ncbi:hypothetical protein [Streptomyces sp. NPDC005322]|uniref:hypothetical protein n=1 Tax=Streptomyces sp. NPDC005322 TaxID=3157032 RepID=UPI0033AEBB9B
MTRPRAAWARNESRWRGGAVVSVAGGVCASGADVASAVPGFFAVAVFAVAVLAVVVFPVAAFPVAVFPAAAFPLAVFPAAAFPVAVFAVMSRVIAGFLAGLVFPAGPGSFFADAVFFAAILVVLPVVLLSVFVFLPVSVSVGI